MRPADWLIPDYVDVQQALEQRAPDDRRTYVHFELEQLPYTIGSTHQALSDFEFVSWMFVREALASVEPGITVTFGPEDRDRLAFPVDWFFESARRAQNAVVPYLRAAYRGRGVKDSLHDLVRDRPPSIPPDLLNAATTYWEQHGKRLRDYRVLSQHHALASSDARALVLDGRPSLYLVLPNNPEAGPRMLRFSEPTVHASSYSLAAFCELIKFVRRVLRILRAAYPIDRRVFMWTFREPLRIGPGAPPQGCYVERPGSLNENLRGLAAAIEREAAGRVGATEERGDTNAAQPEDSDNLSDR